MAVRLMHQDRKTRLIHGDLMRIDHAKGIVSFFRSDGDRLMFVDTSARSPAQEDKFCLFTHQPGAIDAMEAANLAELLAVTHGFDFEIVRQDAKSSTYRFADPASSLH